MDDETTAEERKEKILKYFRSLPPDSSFLVLDAETEEFFKAETKIHDSEELRKHIIEVQEEAYKVVPYPCIRGYRFAKLKIAKIPAYSLTFELLKKRPDAIFLDLGCCMGAEIRKVVHDGWPISQTIATDIEGAFWDSGHKLFRTAPETYPMKFLAGDAFNDTHLCPTAPVSPTPPSVASVNTLTDLRGHISVIHASSLFHLFDEEKQCDLAKRVASLLDPRPGSIIFGSHAGQPVKGIRQVSMMKSFSHNAESWSELWEEQVFKKGEVKVTTRLVEIDLAAEKLDRILPLAAGMEKGYWLFWSVERL